MFLLRLSRCPDARVNDEGGINIFGYSILGLGMKPKPGEG